MMSSRSCAYARSISVRHAASVLSSIGPSAALTSVRNVRLAMASFLGPLAHALQPVTQLRACDAQRTRGAGEVAAGAMHRLLDQRVFECVQAQAAPHPV